MKKATFSQYMPGTPEYVVMHAKWQISRGRRPSATLPFMQNPRRALAWAERYAYFPEGGKYLGGGVPSDYVCTGCKATNVKLWRQYQSSTARLMCARCAADDQKKSITDIDANGRYTGSDGSKTDQIGWMVPAVPTEDNQSYWGYTSVPEPGVQWWRRLPTPTTIN